MTTTIDINDRNAVMIHRIKHEILELLDVVMGPKRLRSLPELDQHVAATGMGHSSNQLQVAVMQLVREGIISSTDALGDTYYHMATGGEHD